MILYWVIANKPEIDATHERPHPAIDAALAALDNALKSDPPGVRRLPHRAPSASQPVHDRLRRSWRHLDFFQFEAWLHCEVPRVACGGCGKTKQVAVPWARPGSGFTAVSGFLQIASRMGSVERLRSTGTGRIRMLAL